MLKGRSGTGASSTARRGVVAAVVATVALVATMAVAPRAPVGAATTFTRITSGTSDVYKVLISSDGRWVAYNREKAAYLYDRQMATTTTLATVPGAQDSIEVRGISDDGSQVLFDKQGFTDVGPHLWSRATGMVTRIGPSQGIDAFESSLSGDGIWVAFWGDSPATGGQKQRNVWRWNRLTGVATQLTPTVPTWNPSIPYDVHISADGGAITFFSSLSYLPDGENKSYLWNGRLSLLSGFAGGAVVSRTGELIADVRPGAFAIGSTTVNQDFVAFLGDDSKILVGSAGSWRIYDRITGTLGPVLLAKPTDQFSPPAASGDGSVLAFRSPDTTLTPGDTNGVDDAYVGVVTPDVDPPSTAPGTPVASNPTSTSVEVTTSGGVTAGPPAVRAAPTGYRFFLYEGSSSTMPVQTKESTTTTRRVTFTGLTPGTRYRFKVAAFNAGGEGPTSAYSAFVVPPFVSFDAFTDRQHRDFAGRAATTAEKADWSTKLTNGTLTPVAAIDAAVDFGFHQKQSPVIRLYRAYFLRLPDTGGLDYWTTRYRSGTSLGAISQGFAGSPEFRTLYGSLSNRAFVELVYQNVLGRPGEAAGIDYWTSQLDLRAKTRGQVMSGFSESPEYKTRTRAIVDAVNVFSGMLRRVPTSAEAAAWAPASDPPARTAVIGHVLASAAYDARV